MNSKLIFKMLGVVLSLEAALMLLPLGIALAGGEDTAGAFVLTILLLAAVGAALLPIRPKSQSMYAREGFLIVSLSWVLLSLFGALPFYASGYVPSYIDALFETVSGFTTTGASILSDVEALPDSLLFWRSFTHWIGGMGILVFVMAILPASNERAMHVMRAEVPGPSVGKLVPKLRSTATLLYAIYFLMTIIHVIFLLFGGMNLFDSLITAFGSAGTGGFSNKNSSIGYFDSAYIDGVVTVFMLLFGINFNLYFLLLTRNFRQALCSEELRWYLIIVLASIGLITLNILPQEHSLTHAFRLASFQVASIITTTGYATADFNLWPLYSKMILIVLMFIGACGGSTGGGLKVSRVIVMLKRVKRELIKMVHPRTVRVIRLEGKALESEQVNGIFTFVITYLLIIVAACLVISLDGFDFETTFTSVLSCISNIGPGTGLVGPMGNFSGFSGFSKLVLSLVMLLGRLEIYPLLLCFAPVLYRKK